MAERIKTVLAIIGLVGFFLLALVIMLTISSASIDPVTLRTLSLR